MRAIVSARAGLFVVTVLGLGAIALGTSGQSAQADDNDVLKPVRAPGGATSLARHGELALERLPGEQLIVRLGLGDRQPVAVTNVFVMTSDLLVVEDNGRVTCVSRHDLQPRWMWTLSGHLLRGSPPAEGTGHYVFLTRGPSGQAIVEALSRRTGTPPGGYPVYLPYAPSAGLAANTSMVFIASLGSPRDNKTLTTLELATGSPGWGWYTTGQILGDPVLDPSGRTLIVAGDDGVVTALPATAQTPEQPAWTARSLGRITTTPTVTPEHVVIGSHDGLVRALDLRSGSVLWMKSVGEAVRTPPWVLGGMATEERSTGVEGAPTVKVEVYKGLVFARNVGGLHCFDLQTGELQFSDPKGARSRPLCRRGKWVLVADGERRVSLRDASDKYKVKATLDLSMFDLLPMNTTDGTIYGVTADGGLVAAHPR
jgi:outer membrane protein assembly factor BamB